jgi:hypothetical protein
MKGRSWGVLLLAIGTMGIVQAPETGRAKADAGAAAAQATVAMRRLTPDQYRRSIADIFGGDITISARIEPAPRREGLVSVGATQVSFGASAFEQFDSAAREIARQVTDPDHRGQLLTCLPKQAAAADDRCARADLGRMGRMLFRRPLSAAEVERFSAIARLGAERRQDYYAGIGIALATMLESPQFLFRLERAEPSPTGYQLDAHSKAARISFLIWNAPPDDTLLAAAESGALGTADGLREQVDRLLASPRFEDGVRAFFADMMALDQLDGVQKDPTIYPRFSGKLATDSREQTLRTIVDLLVRRNADYRDLYTTRRTYLSRSLGLLYSIPVTSPTGWERHEFAADDPRTGLLSQPSFLMTHSHPGRSSPTLRGKAIRELLLCQHVPAPPANVNFALVQDVHNPKFATARLRLGVHSENPVCAGCHKLTDPMGLSLENFDGAAGVRYQENGAPIDASATYNQVDFTGPAGLGKALAGDPALSSCLVSRIFAYGTGTSAVGESESWLESVHEAKAAQGGFHLKDLFRTIALGDPFYRPVVKPAAKVATN